MDPLGISLNIVDKNSLKCWNQISPPEVELESAQSNDKSSPFTYNEEINQKIALWVGDITLVDTHAIVNSTNESLNDRSSVCERITVRAGPNLREELIRNIKVCKTGDAKLSKGYNLPARYVIHTVGPRYNVKYRTAAEGALYSCYRNSLQLAKENNITSVAFGVVNSARRGYPPKEGAHIALRTVRRFLEKNDNAFELVVFVVENEDVGVYELLMPLYFPRNKLEELYAALHLPEDIGNETGEPVNADRQIRIIDNPQHARDLEESSELLTEIGSPVIVGKTDFARMVESVDQERNNPEKKPVDQLTLELQRKNRYERLLRRARTEDLSEISGIGCLYQSGTDKWGRPVIVFIGKWFNFNNINLDKALLYLIHLLDTVCKDDYIVIYFHTVTTADNHPSMTWIKEVYESLEYKFRKNLKAFYIVHPTFWTKLTAWWFTTFMASGIKKKVQSIGGIEYLYSIMDMNQLEIPAFITEYDMSVNGIRYYVPS